MSTTLGPAGGGSSLAEVSDKAPDQLSSAEATGDPDPGCSRVVDLDMALGGNAGHSDLYVSRW